MIPLILSTILGFTLVAEGLPEERRRAMREAQRRALVEYDLQCTTVTVGSSSLALWGRGTPAARLHTLPDGSLLVLIGSPAGQVSWPDVSQLDERRYIPPWDGRVVLLRISADGRRWTIWNDWVGSIPIFFTSGGCRYRVASTLEPVAIAAAGCSAGSFSLASAASLLINGHVMGDRTLFDDVRIVPADSVTTWDEHGSHSLKLWSVVPTEDRAEADWDDLVDEMHERSSQAIAGVLASAPSWILPLSAGLDSRLIAAVGAKLGADLHAYAWGPDETVDVAYSSVIARVLDIPWKHVDLGTDYLVRYTGPWAALFGSALHFHGMYQMQFFDAIGLEPPAAVVSGFLGDVLSAHPLFGHAAARHQLYDEWYTHWTADELESLLRAPVAEALEELDTLMNTEFADVPGTDFKKAVLAEVRTRQRLFTSFQATLADYARGAGTPFLNREYANFCLSLPRPALEGRRLLADMYRRHHANVAVIPGTYADEPLIRTGRYLVKRRLAHAIPAGFRVGALRGFRDVPPRMDLDCVQAHGWNALWPIREAWSALDAILDTRQLDAAFAAVMTDRSDVRPLRRLQSVQALAYSLLGS